MKNYFYLIIFSSIFHNCNSKSENQVPDFNQENPNSEILKEASEIQADSVDFKVQPENEEEREKPETKTENQNPDSDQSEYSAYLQNALKAIENQNVKEFETNLSYFSTAIEKNKLKPEDLTEENFRLYTKVINESLYNDYQFSEIIDFDQMIEFFTYKIDQHPENMVLLGDLFQYNVGILKDFDKAIYWYKRAAAKGNINAMLNLAELYNLSLGEYGNAIIWYEKAANKGNIDAMDWLGALYSYEGEMQNLEKAKSWFQKACDKGNNDACEEYNKILIQ